MFTRRITVNEATGTAQDAYRTATDKEARDR
jgi:hypothetical protein